MQLTIEDRFVRYYPPKSQLLKWVGNKQRYAAEITKYFPSAFERYLEPFLGSGSILATISPEKAIASDIFTPLVEIWLKLKSDPEGLVEWYRERINRIGERSKEEIYAEVLRSYNNNPNGPDFLFLTRSCYGGIVRFRKIDGYMSTPCGVHNPISIHGFSKRVLEWHNRLKKVNFLQCDYKEALSLVRRGDFIYCDPPYLHSQSILYGSQGFSLNELFNELERAKSKGALIALSIDGHKKSGNHFCKIDYPKSLFETEIFINCGVSMLKRFQMEGNELKNEDVSDRLLLSYPV